MSALCPNLMASLPHAVQVFANLMLVNYLTHGLNIAQDSSAEPPQDAINAILGGVVSGGTLSGVHAVSHISAGVVGASYLAMQLQTLLGGAGTAPSSSSLPSPPLSTI